MSELTARLDQIEARLRYDTAAWESDGNRAATVDMYWLVDELRKRTDLYQTRERPLPDPTYVYDRKCARCGGEERVMAEWTTGRIGDEQTYTDLCISCRREIMRGVPA